MNQKTKIFTSFKMKIGVLFLSIILSIFAMTKNIDEIGMSSSEDSLNKAFIVFATAKALNAVVSLLQGTQVGPPGANFSVGEILDPLNDLIEQFSWIMLASIASIGLQQILMELFSYTWFNVFLVFFVLGINLYLFLGAKEKVTLKNKSIKVLLLVLFVRFCIPLMIISNQFIYENIVQNKYSIEDSNNKLNLIEDKLSLEETKKEQKNDSFFEKLASSIDLSKKIDDYKKRYEDYKQSTKDASVYITNLIIVFLFQCVFFPILFLFILYKLIMSDFIWRTD